MRWTRWVLLTRAPDRGRRSRVVLTPRRWRQVGGKFSADDGDKKARSPGRARRKPLKPLRRECRVISAEPVVSTLVCFLPLHTRPRVRPAPGIPCALVSLGRMISCTARAQNVSREGGGVSNRHRPPPGRRTRRPMSSEAIPFFLCAARWIASLALAMTVGGSGFAALQRPMVAAAPRMLPGRNTVRRFNPHFELLLRAPLFSHTPH
jgi:hypothetical protein